MISIGVQISAWPSSVAETRIVTWSLPMFSYSIHIPRNPIIIAENKHPLLRISVACNTLQHELPVGIHLWLWPKIRAPLEPEDWYVLNSSCLEIVHDRFEPYAPISTNVVWIIQKTCFYDHDILLHRAPLKYRCIPIVVCVIYSYNQYPLNSNI